MISVKVQYVSEDGEASCRQRKMATNDLVLEYWHLQLSIILNYSQILKKKGNKGLLLQPFPITAQPRPFSLCCSIKAPLVTFQTMMGPLMK